MMKAGLSGESDGDLLRQFEDEFADRYTESDAEYMQAVDRLALCHPPVISPWRVNSDSSRRSGDRNHASERDAHHQHQGYNKYPRHSYHYRY